MKAIGVGAVTLVGVPSERPSQFGNCFGVECDDGRYRQVVNFNHENLEALEKLGLTWPIEIEALSDRVAVIMDGRIGERWYQERFCEVCCPASLLPITQLHRHQRDVARGRRIEGNWFVQIRFDSPVIPFE